MSFILSISIDILYALRVFLQRFMDRGMKMNMKRDPENYESDSPNTKIRD